MTQATQDQGNAKWEQFCPGALYVALSRAKTMGTFTSDTEYPLDSAIYWYGSGISQFRILEVGAIIEKIAIFTLAPNKTNIYDIHKAHSYKLHTTKIVKKY